ncbi:amino acid ABC transporter ATP-binding protein [Serratia sp. M24T3]|uniref:amino acid ABC transporter ATP-binding protein n=1 Tax=Serratia sp. M24T3 TaxID=932213 RepID=UPI00025BA298|nr:amino acid ABC transporter ATP-binding protein [Serratia sp. M24T3]EIC86116.1 amino acid ABC transporter nucleotide binding/ATPase protein [Serratia sp. M24T3]
MEMISVQDIHKSFGSLAVLKGVSLKVEQGEVVALIGRSGSGKSTLLRCLNGLEKADSGYIAVAGHELGEDKLRLRAMRQDVGMVFQSYNLFPHLTVEENIMLAPMRVKKVSRSEARATAQEMLQMVGLADKAESYASQLSGGQQQRVAIARSLAMKPKVMLFDEVTSALDPELTAEVLAVMAMLAKGGMTMVLVTHEMAFARQMAGRIIFMHNGKIGEQGRAETFFEQASSAELKAFIGSDIEMQN